MAGSEYSSPEIFATRLADPNICTCSFLLPASLIYIIFDIILILWFCLMKQLE